MQKTAPDRKVYDAERDALERKINDLKLHAAKQQWELQQKREAIQEVQNDINAHKEKYEDTNNRLEELRSDLNEAKQNLDNKYNGRRPIKNPAERIRELQADIGRMHNELRNGQLSNAQETKTHRQIKLVQREIQKVQEYIDSNVDDLVQAKQSKLDSLKTFQKAHMSVREHQDAMYASKRQMIEERKALEEDLKKNAESIANLIDQKGEVQQHYERDLQSYKNWKQSMTEVRYAIASLKAQKDEMAGVEEQRISQAEANKSKAEEAARERRAAAERKAAEEEAAAQRKADLDKRRQAALLEYERVQEKFKAAATRQEQETVEPAPAPVVYKHDPYTREKHLCNSLISLCTSMKPSDSPSKGGKKKRKRKKKKTKISVSARNFSNFAEVGVKPPTATTQLDKTIEALRARIEWYDNPPAEEDEVEDQVEEEPEEAVAEEPAPEPSMEPVIEETEESAV